MTTLFSKTAQYAIQALLFLAERVDQGYLTLGEIAAACKIPESSLGLLMQQLIRYGLVESQRGIGGGIRLASPPEQITLLGILEPMDGPPPEPAQCVIGLDRCSSQAVCPLHEEWTQIRDLIQEALIHQTLADLVEGMRSKRDLMANLPTTV